MDFADPIAVCLVRRTIANQPQTHFKITILAVILYLIKVAPLRSILIRNLSRVQSNQLRKSNFKLILPISILTHKNSNQKAIRTILISESCLSMIVSFNYKCWNISSNKNVNASQMQHKMATKHLNLFARISITHLRFFMT